MAVGKIRTGVILIVLGILLLLNTTGVLDLGIWEAVAVLWPLVLIAIGIEKIFVATRTLKPLAYLSPVIIVAVAAYAVVTATGKGILTGGEPDREAYEWSVSGTPEVALVALNMEFGGGRLKVRGGASPGKLLEGRFYHRGRKPRTVADRRGDSMEISISRGSGRHVSLGRHDRERWIVKLSETVPIDLSLDAGAARVRLDLAEVALNSLDLSTGAADIDLILGAKSPQIDCEIDCGAASIDVVVPAGAGLRVERESALSSFSAGRLELVQRGSYWETPDFESKPVQVMLRIAAGVSSLRIRESDDVGVGATI